MTGFTVAGQRVTLLPGEYHVHRLRPKAVLTAAALRFVGAHGCGNDVHIKLPDDADVSKVLSVEVQPAEEPCVRQRPSAGRDVLHSV